MRAEEITGQLKCITNSYKILLTTVDDKVTFSPILETNTKTKYEAIKFVIT